MVSQDFNFHSNNLFKGVIIKKEAWSKSKKTSALLFLFHPLAPNKHH